MAGSENGNVEDSSYVPIKRSRWAVDDSETEERQKDETPEAGEIISDEKKLGKVEVDSDVDSAELNKKELAELEVETVEEEFEEQRPDRGSASYDDSEQDEESTVKKHRGLPGARLYDMLQGCRSVDEFERMNRIDEGTYGVVYRARDKKTGEVVALKRVKMEKEREGFPLTSLREINILLSIHHSSIVDVKEVVVGSNLDSIFMVMEYMDHDLKGLMTSMKQPFSQSEAKCLMRQLLEGMNYLHENWILHRQGLIRICFIVHSFFCECDFLWQFFRDLKTSNLLMNNSGDMKICDFGLARQYGSPLRPYTQLVVTLWYR